MACLRADPFDLAGPQICTSLIVFGAVIVGMNYPDTAHPGFLMAFAGFQTMPQMFLLWQTARPLPT